MVPEMLTLAKVCVIFFANDMGAMTTHAIRTHEIAHCVCPDWKHPPRPGMYAKDTKPPKQCLGAFRGTLYERPVSQAEAIRICGSLGCAFPEEW
jgi:hypothetical protein